MRHDVPRAASRIVILPRPVIRIVGRLELIGLRASRGVEEELHIAAGLEISQPEIARRVRRSPGRRSLTHIETGCAQLPEVAGGSLLEIIGQVLHHLFERPARRLDGAITRLPGRHDQRGLQEVELGLDHGESWTGGGEIRVASQLGDDKRDLGS